MRTYISRGAHSRAHIIFETKWLSSHHVHWRELISYVFKEHKVSTQKFLLYSKNVKKNQMTVKKVKFSWGGLLLDPLTFFLRCLWTNDYVRCKALIWIDIFHIYRKSISLLKKILQRTEVWEKHVFCVLLGGGSSWKNNIILVVSQADELLTNTKVLLRTPLDFEEKIQEHGGLYNWENITLYLWNRVVWN